MTVKLRTLNLEFLPSCWQRLRCANIKISQLYEKMSLSHLISIFVDATPILRMFRLESVFHCIMVHSIYMFAILILCITSLVIGIYIYQK